MPATRKCDCGTCPRCKHRTYMRAWYWRNRDKVCESERERRQRNVDTIRAFDRARGYRPGHEEKRRARRMVTTALANGTLVREPCEVCRSKNVHGHHDDYSKPLAVRWLCPRHHGEAHRRALPGSPSEATA